MESAAETLAPELAGTERIIASLAQSAARPVKEIESLFLSEYARLAANAKVRTHLTALVASNVRSMLKRVPAESLAS